MLYTFQLHSFWTNQYNVGANTILINCSIDIHDLPRVGRLFFFFSLFIYLSTWYLVNQYMVVRKLQDEVGQSLTFNGVSGLILDVKLS